MSRGVLCRSPAATFPQRRRGIRRGTLVRRPARASWAHAYLREGGLRHAGPVGARPYPHPPADLRGHRRRAADPVADAGAAALAAYLGRSGRLPGGRRPDAVVLAGLPGRAAAGVGTWDEELDVRTSCPTHRGTLSDDTQVRRGSLGEALPDGLLAAAYDAELALPALFLIGGTDPLADRAALLHTAESLPRARLSVVRDARHDVLNDVQHRSVAAEIVTFLESLRGGLVPAVAVETSAW
ncbi:alpha/beta hydrolase [Streptomyces olivaceus]|uniref:alpha/beta hydrolase n=1 Tax=Streptomyces olivaceus TaxID=47716 RepID=UPI003B984D4F